VTFFYIVNYPANPEFQVAGREFLTLIHTGLTLQNIFATEHTETTEDFGQLGVLGTHRPQNEFLRRYCAFIHKLNCVALIFKLAETTD